MPVAGSEREGLLVAQFARPGDTVAYAVGDAVADSTSAPTAMALAGPTYAAGGDGYITAVLLQKGGATVTNAAFRIYLWNALPTLVGDNLPYTALWADRAKLVGHAEVVLRTEGAGSDMAFGLDDARRIPFSLAAADAVLYATLCAEAAYAPASAEPFRLVVAVERA